MPCRQGRAEGPDDQGGSQPSRAGPDLGYQLFSAAPDRQATSHRHFSAESWAWTEPVPGNLLSSQTASFATRTSLLQLASTDHSVRRRPTALCSVFSRELVPPTKSSVTVQFPLMRAEVFRRKRGDGPSLVRVPARKRRGMQIAVALQLPCQADIKIHLKT